MNAAYVGPIKRFHMLCIKGLTMTNQQIIDLYQRKLNMTLRELSQITGKSIPELKRILMG